MTDTLPHPGETEPSSRRVGCSCPGAKSEGASVKKLALVFDFPPMSKRLMHLGNSINSEHHQHSFFQARRQHHLPPPQWLLSPPEHLASFAPALASDSQPSPPRLPPPTSDGGEPTLSKKPPASMTARPSSKARSGTKNPCPRPASPASRIT